FRNWGTSLRHRVALARLQTDVAIQTMIDFLKQKTFAGIAWIYPQQTSRSSRSIIRRYAHQIVHYILLTSIQLKVSCWISGIMAIARAVGLKDLIYSVERGL